MSRIGKSKSKANRKENNISRDKKPRKEKKPKSKRYKEADEKRVRFSKNTKKKSKTAPELQSTASSHSEIASIASEKSHTSPSTWENIVLYYLKKLKNLWGSEEKEDIDNDEKSLPPTENKFVGSKCKYPRDIKSSEQSASKINFAGSLENLIGENVSSEKSKQIICAAIDYGIANGILEKCGDFFKIISEGSELSEASLITLHKRTVSRDEELDEFKGNPRTRCTRRPKNRVRKPVKPLVKAISASSVTSKESRTESVDSRRSQGNHIIKYNKKHNVDFELDDFLDVGSKLCSRKYGLKKHRKNNSAETMRLRRFSNVLRKLSKSSNFDQGLTWKRKLPP